MIYNINIIINNSIITITYQVRPPQPPVYMFLIDVSYTAVVTGRVRPTLRTCIYHHFCLSVILIKHILFLIDVSYTAVVAGR